MSAAGPSSRLPALGPRGEGWVALQVALFVLLAVSSLLGPRWPASWSIPLWLAGLVLTAGAVPLVLGGLRRLGAQLTPYPRPIEGGTLQVDGVYRFVRHPIYGGVLLLALAVALIGSPLAVGPALLLVGLFEAKHRREELWLVERYPAYAVYRDRVRRRFIPFLW